MSQKIIEKIANQQFQEDYIRYAIYITYRRVLSDYRDGLKPVQRRILYAMYKNSKAISSTVKSAAVVGDVMKYYHPHGDAGIYGTIKPLVNWFEAYVPLITGQGNFGSFQGDDASDKRYTECKLSKFSMEAVLGDLIEADEVVDWDVTYDEKTKEPAYLPVKVPLLLINGSFGIGLGLKSEIPTHNINEVIDATINLIKNPNADVVLVPDHCQRCDIYNTDFKSICDAGFGYYKIRGVIEVEDYKNRKALVIKSVPNLTYLNNITDKIEQLVGEKKIIQIENMFDESSEGNMRYVIVLKPGADPEFVKDVIYKNTKLEQKIRINFETLNGLNLMRMSYRSYLLSFIDFRRMTKFRLYANKLQAVQTKIHEREAYIKVLESGYIDEIINMIKKQKTVDDTRTIEFLISKINITDLQAKYIIEAGLKKLSIGYLNKYKSEAVELETVKRRLMEKITNDQMIEQEIIDELLDIKKKYGCPRRCRIVNEDIDNNIPKGEMIVVVTEKNYIKKIPVNTPIGNFKGDSIKDILRADNTSNILIFDEMGKVYKLPVHKIPFSDRNSNGVDIRFIIKGLTANINSIIPEDVFLNMIPKNGICKHNIVVVTRGGLIKRMSLDDFITVPPSGIIYTKVEDGDSVKDIILAHESMDIIVYSDHKAIKINVSNIPYLKRNTKGSKAMSNANEIDGMCVINPSKASDLIVITKSGKINRLHIVSSLPSTTKGKSGFNVIKLNKGDTIQSILSANPTDIINVKTLNTQHQIPVESLSYGSSISVGTQMIPIKGDQILRCYTTKNKQ